MAMEEEICKEEMEAQGRYSDRKELMRRADDNGSEARTGPCGTTAESWVHAVARHAALCRAVASLPT